MSMSKPYFRITRESVNGSQGFCKYALDNRYADDRGTLCRSYKMLENDMKKVFEYVEPCDDNLQVYSHRIYELFLRSATEFESNCKGILKANDYSKTRNLNINDYYKINRATKLNEYEVYINIWKPTRKQIRPFEDWEKGHS
jgi:Lhr-like helicase